MGDIWFIHVFELSPFHSKIRWMQKMQIMFIWMIWKVSYCWYVTWPGLNTVTSHKLFLINIRHIQLSPVQLQLIWHLIILASHFSLLANIGNIFNQRVSRISAFKHNVFSWCVIQGASTEHINKDRTIKLFTVVHFVLFFILKCSS